MFYLCIIILCKWYPRIQKYRMNQLYKLLIKIRINTTNDGILYCYKDWILSISFLDMERMKIKTGKFKLYNQRLKWIPYLPNVLNSLMYWRFYILWIWSSKDQRNNSSDQEKRFWKCIWIKYSKTKLQFYIIKTPYKKSILNMFCNPMLDSSYLKHIYKDVKKVVLPKL